MHRRVAALVAFITSAAVLVMEIVAARLLAPYVGVTLQTYTAIIGVVLAGISLGAWLGGRLADNGDPVRLMCLTLVVAGGLMFASLALLRFSAWLFTEFGERLHVDSPPLQAVLLVIFAFLPSALVASMVSPLLVKASLQDLDRTGREVGRISAVGTAGAIFGTFIAGFLLVATIPSPLILLLDGALLVAMGAVLWLTTRRTNQSWTGEARVPLAMLLVAGGLGATVPLHDTPCDVETSYFCASVINDGPRVRILQLDTLLHSAVDLDDDTKLIFEYTLSIGAATDVAFPAGQSIRALHIGGGGFSIPRYIRKTRPGSYNLVIERDPAVIQLDKEKLGLVTDDSLVARAEDGRVAMRRADAASYDLVVGDAFGGEAVPWHLATKEFTALVRRSLRPSGLFAQNVIDGAPAKFVRAETATVMSVFTHVAVVAPTDAFSGDIGANYIVLASDSPLPVEALAARHREVGLSVQVLAGSALQEWVGSARVLTDSFAPVDQLLTVEG